jgi:hypothetical protein
MLMVNQTAAYHGKFLNLMGVNLSQICLTNGRGVRERRDGSEGAMKKPDARGPSPGQKAKKALGQKLNRPSKPPPSPNELRSPRPADRNKSIKNGR